MESYLNLDREKPKQTIVIVEDSWDVLQILPQIIDLYLPGRDIITTDDRFKSQKYQAIEITNRLTTPTLFLVDYHLPGTNGLRVIEEIRSHALVPTEFVLVTGDESEEVHARARRMGVDTFYKFQHMGGRRVGKDYNFSDLFIATIEFAEGRLANSVKHIFDRKTGAYTEDGLAEQWVQVWNRMKRDGSMHLWAAFLFMDVNDFKLINDRFEDHEPGDLVLHEIMKAIRQGVRNIDPIGRMGDEFMAVLLLEIHPIKADGGRKTSEEMFAEAYEQVDRIARRIKSLVELLRVEVKPGEIITTSISVGIEIVNPWTLRDSPPGSSRIPFEDFRNLKRKADTNSYADKLAHYERLAAEGDKRALEKYEEHKNAKKLPDA